MCSPDALIQKNDILEQLNGRRRKSILKIQEVMVKNKSESDEKFKLNLQV